MVPKLKVQDRAVIDKIWETISEKEKFLITSHYNIDGDGLGSEIALYILLKKSGKKVEIVNHDDVPAIYEFLPCAGEVKNISGMNIPHPDVSIVVDCGTIERTGSVETFARQAPVIVNIDHHFSNTRFGTVNFVGEDYSATGEMVYFLLEKQGMLSKDQADCLYTAILTDTGRFIYNMGCNTLAVARELIKAGALPENIARRVYMEKPLKSLRLLSLALRTLKYEKEIGVCWMKVDKKMYMDTGTTEEETEGFVEMLMSTRESKAAFLIKEGDGIKVSMRSKGLYDVEMISRKFGGGGHRMAAGCMFRDSSITLASKKIIEALKEQNGRNNNSK
ncbi:MAG TPA: bifunctional oligoribonuclease/PAP phosphatase NrnA [bacterium]|nr:bifunctional oligoribonuclease/PAP phosphatase NrnA [bacterium]